MRPSLLRACAFAMVSMFLMPTVTWSDPIPVGWFADSRANLSHNASTGGFTLFEGGTSSWTVGAEAALLGGNDFTFAKAQTHHTGTFSATGLTASGSAFAHANEFPSDSGDLFFADIDESFFVSFGLPGPYRYSYHLRLETFDFVDTNGGAASLSGPAGFIFDESTRRETIFLSGDGRLGAGTYEFTVGGFGTSFVEPPFPHPHKNGYLYDFALSLTPVPEPSTFLLLGLGAVGAFRLHRNRRR